MCGYGGRKLKVLRRSSKPQTLQTIIGAKAIRRPKAIRMLNGHQGHSLLTFCEAMTATPNPNPFNCSFFGGGGSSVTLRRSVNPRDRSHLHTREEPPQHLYRLQRECGMRSNHCKTNLLGELCLFLGICFLVLASSW